MREDYKFKTKAVKLEIEIEIEVAAKLESMEKVTKITKSELTNTALKRFISAHKDFLPTDDVGSRN